MSGFFIYQGNATHCSAQDVSSWTDYSFYAAVTLPTPIPPNLFSDISFNHCDVPDYQYAKAGSEIGFKTFNFTSTDGLSFTTDAFESWNKKLSEQCFPGRLSDGKNHCLPVSMEFLDYYPNRGDFFDDGACSESIFGVIKGKSSDLDGMNPAESCGSYHLYRVPATPLASPTIYRRDQANACTLDTSAYLSNANWYRATDCSEAKPSEFVSITSAIH